MNTWNWIGTPILFAIHDRLIAEHGGPEGIRDQGAIESALARPINFAAYDDAADAAALAAAYAYGLARNHGFADGNKRVAWVAARLFLADNGESLSFDPVEAVRLMEDVAGGRVSEAELAHWLRERLKADPSRSRR